MVNKKLKILIFDVETSPNIGAYFELWKEGNIVWNDKDWYMLSFVAKEFGSDKIIARSLPDYKTYKKNKEDDSELVKELWHLFDSYDVLVAHNGDQFDVKKTNARFILNGLPPPSPYRTIDTKKVAKKYFRFDSNKLTDLGRYLGIGTKMETGGWQLWKSCMDGDMDAWKRMVKYNKQDVILLEKIYLKLLPWINNHPNIALANGRREGCPNCGSSKVQKRGTIIKGTTVWQTWYCWDCKSRPSSPLKDGSQLR